MWSMVTEQKSWDQVASDTADLKMRWKILAVIYLLGLQFWIQDVAGGQIDHRLPGWRCRCRKVTTDPVEKSSIRRIELIPSKTYCPKAEIVIQTKKNERICVDPEAEWLENMLPRLVGKMKQHKE